MNKTFEVKFYVGIGYTENGVAITNVPERIAVAEQRVCDAFGGVTRYDHTGSWIESLGTPAVSEFGVTLVAIVSEDKAELIRETAQFLKGLFSQNCILITRTAIDAEFV